ncbi:hypothetical protein [Paenibacillus sp. YYML68]|uniref:hypothetical protein n=1 Tax=Paenibacillus sp. YYML68 TaxID=2909250 RepID=UPI002490BEEE|nr:hypothetical protein [Paenibacillus sp. YYML68]
MRRRMTIWSLALVTLLLIGRFLYTEWLAPPVDIKEVEPKVIEHLGRKGEPEDRYDLSIKYSWESRWLGYDPYVIKVVFKDEPDAIYHYTYDYKSKLKEVRQTGIAPMNDRDDKNFKHME